MARRTSVLVLAIALFTVAGSAALRAGSRTTAQAAPQGPRFERVLALDPGVGVFAYSRISPDGRYLAYAAETREGRRNALVRTITVVDLSDGRVLFTEPGIDAYFSPDGRRMIYFSAEGRSNVTIRHHDTGELVRDVAPTNLGDYYSWGLRDGRNLILTINSRFYYLDGDKAVLPAGTVPSCEGHGRGDRPLLSRDGMRITTFVRGNVVVRSLTDCDFILNTGIPGQKADFSWDGRHVAFHVQKSSGRGYEIQVVDTQERTVRTVTSFSGSSLFPSWTRDGRLSFRYDGEDYRGFMMASNVLSAPARPLPTSPRQLPDERTWDDVFPETERAHATSVVLVWGPWSAHSPDALAELVRAGRYFRESSLDVGVMHAVEPGSLRGDAADLIDRYGIRLPEIPLAPERFQLSGAHNQNPTTLLFRSGRLIDLRMGAQTFEQLRDWVLAAQ
jgi:hypothetical protein